MGLDVEAWQQVFAANLEDLKNFQFSFLNPLFWFCILLLFLMLLKIWEARKSFSFSLVVSIILLATTKFENIIATALAKPGEPFDTAIIRLVSLFIIAFIFLIYAFLR